MTKIKQSLNVNESKALEAVKIGINDGWQTDEITQYVANELKCSLNSAKGYLSVLVQKEYITKHEYKDNSIGKIIQFSLNE